MKSMEYVFILEFYLLLLFTYTTVFQYGIVLSLHDT